MPEHTPLISFGESHEFADYGLQLTFSILETFTPNMDIRDRAERRGFIGDGTYFRVGASVRNTGLVPQRLSLHYQYQTARVGEEGDAAIALELSDGHIYGMTLHPGRKVRASFSFVHPVGAWNLVDLESDLHIESPNLKRLTSTWTGFIGHPVDVPTLPKDFPSSLSGAGGPHAPDVLVSQGEFAIRNRDEARRIVSTNPRLALELGIGDPTRQAGFDDGGVVDINGLSVEVLAETLRLPLGVAGRILRVRDQLGGHFSSVEEISLYADLTPREEQLVRERAVVLPW